MILFSMKETPTEHQDRVGQWHVWFAWRPVWIDRDLVWREYVERRMKWHDGWDREYRRITPEWLQRLDTARPG